MAILDSGTVTIGKRLDAADDLVACDIVQLEHLFAVAGDNAEALITLQDELRYRQSQRALALLSRVQDALARRASH